MTDYLILVNEDNRLPDSFEDSVELISVKNVENEEFRIEKKTYEAFLKLQADMLENEGQQIDLISVYRSIEDQVKNWANYENTFGLEYTKQYVAIPGHSEHHTGLAIDVSFVVDGKLVRMVPNLLKIDPLYKPLQEKLPKYGFILRYPAGKEPITKINYEPWHFRYLDDPELAENITNRGICFEEYWEERK